MLDPEGPRDLVVVDGQSDLLPGLAAGYLVYAGKESGRLAVAVEGAGESIWLIGHTWRFF